MGDPFFITGPALISFSGGRTSAYMLWRILQAHGGQLPADVIVAFANTGKEREETLRFVHECGSRWGVHIHWLEWKDGDPGFEVVGLNSASRSGEPFAGLIARKGYLPNRGAGYCSIELKGRVIRDFVRAERGWKNWNSYIGLRADEGVRVMNAMARNRIGKDPWRSIMPLAEVGASRANVLEYWHNQDFDLGLLNYEGNCDLCWKKGEKKRLRIIRDDPTRAKWWADMEASVNQDQSANQFDPDASVASLLERVRTSPMLPIFLDDEEHDAECGDMCGGDTPAEIAALQADFESLPHDH